MQQAEYHAVDEDTDRQAIPPLDWTLHIPPEARFLGHACHDRRHHQEDERGHGRHTDRRHYRCGLRQRHQSRQKGDQRQEAPKAKQACKNGKNPRIRCQRIGTQVLAPCVRVPVWSHPAAYVAPIHDEVDPHRGDRPRHNLKEPQVQGCQERHPWQVATEQYRNAGEHRRSECRHSGASLQASPESGP